MIFFYIDTLFLKMLKIILPLFLLQKYDMYDNDAYFFTKLYLKNVLNFVMIYSVTNSFFFSILVSSELFNNYLVSNNCLFYDYFFFFFSIYVVLTVCSSSLSIFS